MDNAHNIEIDQSAVNRILQLREQGMFSKNGFLRIAVEGGGCSGFQYKMEEAVNTEDGDIVFSDCVVIDDTSVKYMKDSVIVFKNDLMGAMFVVENPNASSSCGCQVSFSIDPSKIM